MSTTTGPQHDGRLRRAVDLRVLRPVEPAAAGGHFAWAVSAAHLWILGGLFLDGWFHINRGDSESFFTPWHAVLYSGVAATVAVHLWEANRSGGTRPGYAASLAGGVVVLLAGVVDGAWHTALGVEADLEALLSPPHLLLITAGTLVFAGPLRAALRAGDVGAGGLPTAVSAAFVVTGLGFFTQYANPFTHLYPVAGYAFDGTTAPSELREVAGVSGVVVWAVMIGAAVALLRARTVLVTGSLAVSVAVPTLFMTTQRGTYAFVPAILLAAVFSELVGRRTSPALAALTATAALATGWVLTLAATEDVAWSAELLGGSIGSAAAAGYLVGWLVQSGGRSPGPA
ncbi:MAG: hypothetical protein JWN08_450 [Frankiales bacterium]|nr:hypothetical protein [Frankiales bacterium]